MQAWLQKLIHFIEEGEGAQTLRLTLVAMAFVAISMFYHIVSFRNFNAEEAMDTAQLARNISKGEGYTTKYIRPFSLALIQAQTNRKVSGIHKQLEAKNLSEKDRKRLESEQIRLKKMASLKTPHPDLANPPLYPTLLAGFMSVAPIDYKIPFQIFQTYGPELWIAGFNQAFFFLAILLLFRIARQLFGPSIAWISAILFTATDLFWRFSISGLSTMLLVVIFLCTAWMLVRFERQTRENLSARRRFFSAILAGVFVGLGCLTRYSFGWLIGPVLIFLLLFSSERRWRNCFGALLAFVLVISPWLARNYSLCGEAFGMAGYAICQGTPAFPEDQLERSLEASPVFSKILLSDYARKFFINAREILENEIPKIGGNWLTLFFLTGLLVPLRNPAQTKLRYFVLFSLFVLLGVQAFGRTHLTNDAPQINSENLMVLLSPLVFVFGVSFYFELFNRIVFSALVLRYAANFLFCAIVCVPMIFSLLPPRVSPVAYPPYYPPTLQETGGWMRPDELVMCDVPWAMAWYGDRQCVSLTRVYPDDFFTISDDIKPVQALHLTPKTIDGRFLSQMIQNKQGWGRFVVQSLSKGDVPDGFPLKKSPQRFLPDQFFVTDWDRWTVPPK
ncbi:MAG: glycosyltransferase family 39 protein [Verrucomicrobiota bacterium]